MIKPITLYKQVQGLTLIEVPEGIVAHRNTLQEVHYLNHVAAMVLIMCDGKIPIDAICQIIKEEYHLKNTPVEDLEGCVRSLVELGLILPVKRRVGSN